MTVAIVMESGETLKVLDKSYAQTVAAVKAGSFFEVQTDSFPGANAKVTVRPAHVSLIVEVP